MGALLNLLSDSRNRLFSGGDTPTLEVKSVTDMIASNSPTGRTQWDQKEQSTKQAVHFEIYLSEPNRFSGEKQLAEMRKR